MENRRLRQKQIVIGRMRLIYLFDGRPFDCSDCFVSNTIKKIFKSKTIMLVLELPYFHPQF